MNIFLCNLLSLFQITPLFLAVRENNDEIVEHLLQIKGIDINHHSICKIII